MSHGNYRIGPLKRRSNAQPGADPHCAPSSSIASLFSCFVSFPSRFGRGSHPPFHVHRYFVCIPVPVPATLSLAMAVATTRGGFCSSCCGWWWRWERGDGVCVLFCGRLGVGGGSRGIQCPLSCVLGDGYTLQADPEKHRRWRRGRSERERTWLLLESRVECQKKYVHLPVACRGSPAHFDWNRLGVVDIGTWTKGARDSSERGSVLRGCVVGRATHQGARRGHLIFHPPLSTKGASVGVRCI